MTQMTLEERERRAYAEGNVVEAMLLATAIDWMVSEEEIEKRLDQAYDEGFAAGESRDDA